MASKDTHCSCPCPSVQSVCQTLDELEFERSIWYLALHGELEKLKEKLDSGINPSKCDKFGYTALHYAARHGRESVCAFLLKKGADVNAQTNGGATPLHRASHEGHLNVVRILIQHGADLLLCDSDGKTALHKAVKGNHLDVVEELIAAKPELKFMKDNRGNTPRFYASPHCLEIIALCD